MPDSVTAIQTKYGDRFDLTELIAYFASVKGGEFSGREDVEVNLLSPTACVELTDEFCDFHPLFEAEELVELLILDDANTSDHHCYAFTLPYPGAVVYLPHDGTTKIAFRSVGDFLDSARKSIETERFLTDFHSDELFLCPDQAALNETIRRGYQAGDEEPVWLLIQSSDLRDTDLMLQIAQDDNFYFGEAVAERIIAKPALGMLPIANACAQHAHPQVSRPGVKAVEAVRSANGP